MWQRGLDSTHSVRVTETVWTQCAEASQCKWRYIDHPLPHAALHSSPDLKPNQRKLQTQFVVFYAKTYVSAGEFPTSGAVDRPEWNFYLASGPTFLNKVKRPLPLFTDVLTVSNFCTGRCWEQPTKGEFPACGAAGQIPLQRWLCCLTLCGLGPFFFFLLKWFHIPGLLWQIALQHFQQVKDLDSRAALSSRLFAWSPGRQFARVSLRVAKWTSYKSHPAKYEN